RPIRDPAGQTRVGGVASTKINRKDLGLTWNKAIETGGVVVGDEVEITIDIEIIKAGEAPAVNGFGPGMADGRIKAEGWGEGRRFPVLAIHDFEKKREIHGKRNPCRPGFSIISNFS